MREREREIATEKALSKRERRVRGDRGGTRQGEREGGKEGD